MRTRDSSTLILGEIAGQSAAIGWRLLLVGIGLAIVVLGGWMAVKGRHGDGDVAFKIWHVEVKTSNAGFAFVVVGVLLLVGGILLYDGEAEADPTSAWRKADLYSGNTFLRLRPDPDSVAIETLKNVDGLDLKVNDGHERGWFEVELKDGTRGWLFGTFILPAVEGFRVAYARDGSVELLSESGQMLSEAGQSDQRTGTKVLVEDRSEDLWRVRLANGRTAFVQGDEYVLAPNS